VCEIFICGGDMSCALGYFIDESIWRAQHPDMVTALRLAASKGAHFAILSDANTFYIREILEVCMRAFMVEAR
jgi:hypothetical protein